MTLVYYHVPEDQDDPDTPNVFGVKANKNEIRLQHIYDSFPLRGSYIFRFKVMYDNAMAWLDLAEVDGKLPTFKDKIMIKATRVSWETNKENPCEHYRFLQSENKTKINGSHPSFKSEKTSNQSVRSAAQPQAKKYE